MKNILIIFLIYCLGLLISCAKETNSKPVEPTLAGQWKMTLYIDSTSGVSETKEDSYLHFNPFMAISPYPPVGDVKMSITFDDATELTGKMQGTTIFNGFEIKFSRTSNFQFMHDGGMWTLAMDPPWGQYFYNCMQSANSYGFDLKSRLLIKAPSKTLIFERE